MSNHSPTELAGEKLRKAVAEFSELTLSHPDKKRQEILEMVNRKYDLSPLEADFLLRQLTGD